MANQGTVLVKIYLVRHGETSYNRDHLGLGRTDVPLTEFGNRQAAAAARRVSELGVGLIYTSPLQRASALADMAAEGLGIEAIRRDELLEMDVGETEGVPFTVLRERYPGFLESWAGDGAESKRMPGGESVEDVDARLEGFMPLLEQDPGCDIAVVSHNFVVRALLCQLMRVDLSSFRTFGVDLASITTVILEGDEFVVDSINDVAHLRSLEH